MEKNRIKLLEKALTGIYNNSLSQQEVESFARALYKTVFVDRNGFEDLLSVIYESEYDFGVSPSEVAYVVNEVLILLDDSAEVANMLYNYFMDYYEDFNVFLKLTDNAEFLTKEQYGKAIAKAQKIFSAELLKIHGIE